MPPKVKIPRELPTLITSAELSPLPPQQRLTRLYRRFTRLSVFLNTQKQRVAYISLLRSRFTSDYNTRHAKVLNTSPNHTQDLLIDRGANTLTLVSKAFTHTDKMSTSIVLNLINVEVSKRLFAEKSKDKSMYGQLSRWEYHDMRDKPSEKRWGGWISVREFDRTVLRFNESMGMCL